MTLISRIKSLCQDRGITLNQLEKLIGLKGTIARWEDHSPSLDKVRVVAQFFGVSVSELIGDTDAFSAPAITEDAVAFPVIGGVAAGYDHIAYEDWTGDNIEIPRSYLHGRPATDFFVLRVSGDSMFPEFQDGDHVLVLKQATMDRSGQIGVVIYADENSTLKRIEYTPGEDWMTLRPINPQFKPVTIRGAELERCTVLGVAKMVIREVQ